MQDMRVFRWASGVATTAAWLSAPAWLAAMALWPGSLGAQSNNMERVDALVRKVVDGKRIEGAVVSIASGDGSFSYRGSAGTLSADTTYFVASTTKLFVTALVMQLRAEGRLTLDDSLAQHLPAKDIAGLHVLRGVDRSGAITLRHLLAHTSGIPDYFEGKRATGTRLDRELLAGRDVGWRSEDALAWAREMTPKFIPGAHGKAHYSDTNYQLLGLVVERVTGLSFDSALTVRVLQPLDLRNTYVFRDTADRRPPEITGRQGALQIPQAMASFGPDGGVVSTAQEQVVFLRAFFTGTLFPAEYLDEMSAWNRIFFPLQYGVGVMRFRLPRLMSPFSAPPDLRGHSGLSGSFAFYEPERDLYIAGTVNSVANPSAPYRFMLRLLGALKDELANSESAAQPQH